MATANRV